MDPGYLIASPQLKDPNFQRAVVLLLQHDDEHALGLVINRESPVRLGDVLDRLVPVPSLRANRPVLWGGPVERSSGFVLFRGRSSEGWEVRPDFSVSPNRERLSALVASGTEFHLCLGYAGWGAGQLDREVAEGSWLYVEPDPELLFETPIGERYDAALARLGVRADSLWMSPINE